jgi:hypothetical protein
MSHETELTDPTRTDDENPAILKPGEPSLLERLQALEDEARRRIEAALPQAEAPTEAPTLASMVAEWKPKKKVLLATPSNRGLNTQYVASMLNTMGDQRMLDDQIQIMPYLWPGESLISRARNDILRHFYYDTDCTHLFFIDDDIAWDPVCFFDVLAADKDVVGGIYPLKSLRWDKLVGVTIESEQQAKLLTMEIVVNGIQADHPRNDPPLMVCHDLGTGFMCIKREAIDKMVEAFPDDWYASNARGAERHKTLDFFGLTYDGEKGTMESTLLSEDYAFCRRWQAAGGDCYVHTGIPLLVHVGQHNYGRIDS